MNSLPRDGGEHPTYTHTRRPMTPAEVIQFTKRVAPALNDHAKVDVEADGMGGLKVTLWPDDEEGGVVTFAPVKAVKSP